MLSLIIKQKVLQNKSSNTIKKNRSCYNKAILLVESLFFVSSFNLDYILAIMLTEKAYKICHLYYLIFFSKEVIINY